MLQGFTSNTSDFTHSIHLINAAINWLGWEQNKISWLFLCLGSMSKHFRPKMNKVSLLLSLYLCVYVSIYSDWIVLLLSVASWIYHFYLKMSFRYQLHEQTLNHSSLDIYATKTMDSPIFAVSKIRHLVCFQSSTAVALVRAGLLDVLRSLPLRAVWALKQLSSQWPGPCSRG